MTAMERRAEARKRIGEILALVAALDGKALAELFEDKKFPYRVEARSLADLRVMMGYKQPGLADDGDATCARELAEGEGAANR
jgi:hypothetical protein